MASISFKISSRGSVRRHQNTGPFRQSNTSPLYMLAQPKGQDALLCQLATCYEPTFESKKKCSPFISNGMHDLILLDDVVLRDSLPRIGMIIKGNKHANLTTIYSIYSKEISQ